MAALSGAPVGKRTSSRNHPLAELTSRASSSSRRRTRRVRRRPRGVSRVKPTWVTAPGTNPAAKQCVCCTRQQVVVAQRRGTAAGRTGAVVRVVEVELGAVAWGSGESWSVRTARVAWGATGSPCCARTQFTKQGQRRRGGAAGAPDVSSHNLHHQHVTPPRALRPLLHRGGHFVLTPRPAAPARSVPAGARRGGQVRLLLQPPPAGQPGAPATACASWRQRLWKAWPTGAPRACHHACGTSTP